MARKVNKRVYSGAGRYWLRSGSFIQADWARQPCGQSLSPAAIRRDYLGTERIAAHIGMLRSQRAQGRGLTKGPAQMDRPTLGAHSTADNGQDIWARGHIWRPRIRE
ncbi:hypothetical protein AAFF_G00229280 [Aldrovandia affinis]|uniref:Uncharacterized protein n=1 Tax=Aldrovandia affinis TaxID=143900 RepID=A0AAD7WUA8_9TELE|nr:hypothetical protein AAFF_G00229280 [Aldrovandia affinis]